jgi:hypothetical protein|tara:strand:- start:3002 stop:4120 length:1119 start_codon:yes stop_codon:yes gene_type:complete
MADAEISDHSKRGHAKVSPSSLANFEKCPNYRRVDREVELHPVTAEGTLIHEALETGNFSTLDDSQTELAKKCIDYMKTLPTWGKGAVWTEPEVDITPEIWGFVDRVQFNHDDPTKATACDIIDYKFGWARVTKAEENFQGQAYTMGIMKKLRNIKAATMHFTQPRLGYYTDHMFLVDDIDKITKRIEAVLINIARGDMYTEHEGLCEYCGNLSCPIQTQRATSIVTNYVKNDPHMPSSIDPTQITDPSVMSKVLMMLPHIENWCKEARHAGNVMAIQGGKEIPNFTVATRSSKRTITNANEALRIAQDNFDVTLSDFLDAVTISMPKLETLVKAASPRGMKGVNAEKLQFDLEDADSITLGSEISYLKKNK